MTGDTGAPHRSGFVAVVGRPNVGKSTLVNRMVEAKVSIVSDTPQTTRTTIRGVHSGPGLQIVFLDTPGVHRPRTRLGERLNRRALATLDEVDVVCLVVAAPDPVGPGDRFVAAHAAAASTPTVVAVNKTDAAGPAEIASRLDEAASTGEHEAFVPVSARTGDGVAGLLAEFAARLPEGPRYYPEGMVTDQPEAVLAAEVLREKLLAATRDEVPHSIAVVVDDVEERRGGLLALHARVLVERESQKGIVIGSGGHVLKAAGTAARKELEALFGTRVHLETVVRVEKDWQRHDPSLDRLGY